MYSSVLIPSSSGNVSNQTALVTPVSLAFLLLIYALGKWGWKPLWKLPWLGNILNTQLCPDLNGTWEGSLESNFKDKDGNNTITPVRLEIKADMFGFQMTQKTLVSPTQKSASSSEVLQCEVFKDPRTKKFYLYYLYQSTVLNPTKTDDKEFFGAAKLEVVFHKETMELKGNYWTNRAWQRNQNTAGTISVRRKTD